MPNMHYCRFQNTLGDLKEIAESDDLYDPAELSEKEARARKRLIRICLEIASEFEDDEDYA